MSKAKLVGSCIASLAALLWVAESPGEGPPTAWQRHVIDNSLRGADGVRLADFNGDGLPDVVTGWEESGIVRLYLHPGEAKVKWPWPAVTVGKAKSPEDAVPFDVDGDGRLDVVSCHEGKTRKVFVHFQRSQAPESSELLAEQNWHTERIQQLDGQLWMFATPIGDVEGRSAMVLGSKGGDATITLLVAPPQSRGKPSQWSAHPIRPAGWIMSLQAIDMDADGDLDVVFSDRKGSRRGVGWLEHPNTADATSEWPEHLIGGSEHEVMFVDASPDRVFVPTRDGVWLDLRRGKDETWAQTVQDNPPSVPWGKAIKRLTMDELVMTANTLDGKSEQPQIGIWRLTDGRWHSLGTATRAKFDRIECLDLDGDGDLDVMTCEERRNLGVVWYENPAR